MGNKKYYILLQKELGREPIDGPFTFKEVEREREWWDAMGVKSKVLKTIIDIDGKEVK